MRTFLIGLLGVLSMTVAACSDDGPSGEPAGGDVVLTFGGTTSMGLFGAAVLPSDTQDTTKMEVVIGTNGIDCDYASSPSFHIGTLVNFTADKTTPMADDSAFINVENTSSDGDGLHLYGTGSEGSFAITAIDDRVTGSIAFTTESDEHGTVSANGDFDVKRCF